MRALSAGILSMLVGVLVLGSVWLPPIANHYVSENVLSSDVVELLRKSPESERLIEMNSYMFGATQYQFTSAELIKHADNLLLGVVSLPNSNVSNIYMPFNQKDLPRGHSAWQLAFGSFNVVSVLVNAYEESGNDKYLTTATDFILAWYQYERTAILPLGFLWNDHAIASRVSVLILFWQNYRNSEMYDEEVATQIIQLTMLSAEHLAKKEQFTFATNHGVMQNLSLMRVGVAFSAIAGSEQLWSLGYQRLIDQLGFFINDEGVILEHSALYHVFGFQLLGEALRYMTMMNVNIPPTLSKKYRLATEFTMMLCHPDNNTLPRLGDTTDQESCKGIVSGDIVNGKMRPLTPLAITSPTKPQVYPAAGYAINWFKGSNQKDLTSQTIFNWSNHRGHGHKHADDLSINILTNEMRWLTAAGYYPYIYAGRHKAISWGGSNAPHFNGELARNNRASTINGYHESPDIIFADAQRVNSDQTTFRRQLIQLGTHWIVLDSYNNKSQQPLQINWMADAGATITKSNTPNHFRFNHVNTHQSMATYLTSSDHASAEITTGVVESNNKPVVAPLISWQLAPDTKWSIMAASLQTGGTPSLIDAQMIQWQDDNHWTIRLNTSNGQRLITRNNNQLTLDNQSSSFAITTYAELPDLIASQAAFIGARAKYSPYKQKDLISYRDKITSIIMLLLSIQLFILVISNWLNRPKLTLFLVGSATLAWPIIAIWLHLFYFVT